jgi:hypothetical protein
MDVKRVILYIIVGIILILLIAKAYSYSSFDMEKKIKAEQEDFSISIIPEAEILSLQQGSFSILKLGISIDSYYGLSLNYTIKSNDLIGTISPHPDNTKYSYTKVLNIEIPKTTSLGEHKIQVKVNASNGFKEKTFEKEIIVKVTSEDSKYIFNSNINNSIPEIEVKEWNKNMHIIGKQVPVDNFNITVVNIGANSDFYPVFKEDSNCFYIVPNFYYVNLQSNVENTLYFTIYFDNNTNCKDSIFQVSLKDMHTGKEYFLGNEYITFLKEVKVTQPIPIQEEDTNTTTDQDKNLPISTGLTSTPTSNTKINNTTGLFSLENRNVTLGVILLVLIILSVVLFRHGGIFNNAVSVNKIMKKAAAQKESEN